MSSFAIELSIGRLHTRVGKPRNIKGSSRISTADKQKLNEMFRQTLTGKVYENSGKHLVFLPEIFSFWCLMSDKPIHYLLDHGDFTHKANSRMNNLAKVHWALT